MGCMWCALSVGGGGIDMFPDVAIDIGDIPGDRLATEQAIREFLALRFPVVAELVPNSMTSSRKRSVELREAKSKKLGQALIGLLMLAGGGVGLFYAAVYWFVWLGLAGWGAVLIGSRKIESKPFLDAFLQADQALEQEIDAFVRRSGLAEVAKVRARHTFCNSILSKHRRSSKGRVGQAQVYSRSAAASCLSGWFLDPRRQNCGYRTCKKGNARFFWNRDCGRCKSFLGSPGSGFWGCDDKVSVGLATHFGVSVSVQSCSQ